MKKEFVIIILLCLLLFVTAAGCEKPESETLVNECKAACQGALQKSQNLSAGPCLLDPMSNNNWVCDIAHQPREAIDNLRENQCNSWHNGTATHFIELTPECEFIKAV